MYNVFIGLMYVGARPGDCGPQKQDLVIVDHKNKTWWSWTTKARPGDCGPQKQDLVMVDNKSKTWWSWTTKARPGDRGPQKQDLVIVNQKTCFSPNTQVSHSVSWLHQKLFHLLLMILWNTIPLLIPYLTGDDIKLCEEISVADLLVNTAMHSFLTGCRQ
jgi:hypothetical protein